MFSRVCACALVFCLLMNGFVPRFSISGKTYELFSQIATNQSSILTLFSFSTIPLKLVNEIYAGKQGAAQKEHPPKKTEDTANSSADFSLFAQSKTALSERHALGRAGLAHAVVQVSFTTRLLYSLPEAARGAPPGHALAVLVFLVFLFILPRSNISEEVARLRFVCMNPLLNIRAGFFYWGCVYECV